MRISELLKPSLIKVDLKSDDKDELFEEMVQMFVNHDLLADRDVALEAIRGREAKMSTGIAREALRIIGKLALRNGFRRTPRARRPAPPDARRSGCLRPPRAFPGLCPC